MHAPEKSLSGRYFPAGQFKVGTGVGTGVGAGVGVLEAQANNKAVNESASIFVIIIMPFLIDSESWTGPSYV